MIEYINGAWEVKVNKETFEQIETLGYNIDYITDLYANGMTITEADLEMVDNLIEDINITLRSNFEDSLSFLEISDD
jgi:hypothetical protein